MGFIIVQINKVVPQYLTVQGAYGTETSLNPGTIPAPPVGGELVYDERSGLYGDDPTLRVQIYRHSNGTASHAQVLAAAPGLRLKKLAAIRAEARVRIEVKWPLWAQNNVALGLYNETVCTQCRADIAAVITASNLAEDAVLAATDTEAMLAVTASWPTI